MAYQKSAVSLGEMIGAESKKIISGIKEDRFHSIPPKPDGSFRTAAFGDVIGEPGKKAVFHILPEIREQIKPDFMVINGENSAQGFGITNPVSRQFFENGFDVITTGNHVWQKKEVFEFIDHYPGLLRPLNYPPGTPGHGSCVIDKGGIKVGVVNLIGRIYMDPLDCPFQALDKEIGKLREAGIKIILVDFHAEATSEKQIMGWHFDGRITAVWGTHTHIQTSDERLLPNRTAYITDAGMCGSVDSVIGMKISESYRKVIQHLPVRFSPEESGTMEVQGVVIDSNPDSGAALQIYRIKTRV